MRQVPLSSLLGVTPKDRIAVVGAGGKTSVINRLAREMRHLPVLISPTTKIWPVREPGVALCTDIPTALSHMPTPGIHCMGVLNPDSGKLEAFPADILSTVTTRYGMVLMEADGSRGLPLKGWKTGEPVVPAFTTRTVGVISTAGLGLPATEQYVLRFPHFLSLTGLGKGDPVTLEAIADMVTSSQGMFRGAMGTRQLIINQVEDGSAAANANALVRLIAQRQPRLVEQFMIGSAKEGLWQLA